MTLFEAALLVLLGPQRNAMLGETPAVMRARLSALDRVSRITREALGL